MGACILAILGVLLPPVAVLIDKGCGVSFLINLLLTIFLVYIGGILHAFHTFRVPICTNIFCLLLPPVGVLLEFGCTGEFWVSIILTLLGWIPGVIYAYFVNVQRAHHGFSSKV